jgi:hypothetical protein
MASLSDSTALVNENIPHSPDIVKPYLQKALSSSSITGTPVSLFDPASSFENHASAPHLVATWPILRHNRINQIFLFPGSFNPPHQGHLATIRYVSERREQLGIVAMFIFADPDDIIKNKRPHNLPDCTDWERQESSDDLEEEHERSVGVVWVCKALTVPGKPYIQFRASKSSASSGISSTRIRRIMCEAPDEELYERLNDQVLSAKLLVDWLQRYRERKRGEDEGAL